MAEFLTEKKIEALLETEMRILTMPDGKSVPVRGFKMMWDAFDLIRNANMFTEERMIELAYSWSEREGIPFEKTLSNLIAYIHQQAKRIF